MEQKNGIYTDNEGVVGSSAIYEIPRMTGDLADFGVSQIFINRMDIHSTLLIACLKVNGVGNVLLRLEQT